MPLELSKSTTSPSRFHHSFFSWPLSCCYLNLDLACHKLLHICRQFVFLCRKASEGAFSLYWLIRFLIFRFVTKKIIFAVWERASELTTQLRTDVAEWNNALNFNAVQTRSLALSVVILLREAASNEPISIWEKERGLEACRQVRITFFIQIMAWLHAFSWPCSSASIYSLSTTLGAISSQSVCFCASTIALSSSTSPVCLSISNLPGTPIAIDMLVLNLTWKHCGCDRFVLAGRAKMRRRKLIIIMHATRRSRYP